MEYLPKIAQGFAKAVKESWDNENAQPLFTELDDIRKQNEKCDRLISDWDGFWNSSVGQKVDYLSTPEYQDLMKRTTEWVQDNLY